MVNGSTRAPPALSSRGATGRAVDAVVDHILSRIRSGEYAPGDPLVARSLAKELGVGVLAVREALHRLWGEDLVEVQSNRSARIRLLTREDILCAVEVWEVHAGLMGRLAAQRIKIRDNAERIEAAAAAIVSAKAPPNRMQYLKSLTAYLEVLSEIGENPYVDQVRRRLHTEFWSPVVITQIPAELWPNYLESFRQINAAILSAQPEAAEEQFRRHARWVAGLLRGRLPRDAPISLPT